MSSNRGSSSSAREEKDKKKHAKEKAKSDTNDSVDNHGSGENDSQAGTSSKQDDSVSDMAKFCQILQNGFDSVSVKITDKLKEVGDKFGNSLNDLHASLDDRLTELAGRNNASEDDMDWDSVSNSDRRQDGDHNISEASGSSVNGDKEKESFFKRKNKPKPVEKVGDDVDQDLADIVNRNFNTPSSAEDFKKFKDKYDRPGNVEWLNTPEIPYNIYRRLNSDFKDVDKRMKFIQDQLCPVAISLTYALDKLGKQDVEGGMEILAETLEGFGHVFKNDITEKRRSLLKPKLPEDFKVLASEKCPPTPTNLLGNISENSKKITETEKLATQMDRATNAKTQAGKKAATRDKPYSRNGNPNNSAKNGKNNFFKKGGFYNNKRQDSNKRNDSRDYQRNNKNYYNGDNSESYFQKRNQQRK